MKRLVGLVLPLAVVVSWWLWSALTQQPAAPAISQSSIASAPKSESVLPVSVRTALHDAEDDARAASQQAWEDWHALVSRVADDIGGLKLSQSPLFTALVSRLPDEIPDPNATRSAADRVEQTARLRGLHNALEIYHTQWLSMRAAREALAEQRKLWQHLSRRHQFGMSTSQSDAIHIAQQRIEAFALQEDFPAATHEYQRLRSLYEIEEEPINHMLDARRAAMAVRAQWRGLEASQKSDPRDDTEAAEYFEQAQVAAMQGNYATAREAYGQASSAWRRLYQASVSRSELAEDAAPFQ